MEAKIKIFKVGDCDWIAAATAIEAVKCHEEMTDVDDIEPDEVEELDEDDLDRLKFLLTEDPNGPKHSFRVELEKRIAEGVSFPEHFACSEW